MKTPEEKSLHRRLAAFAVVALLILLGFIVRLVVLQLVEGNTHYAAATAPPSSQASASSRGFSTAPPGVGPRVPSNL